MRAFQFSLNFSGTAQPVYDCSYGADLAQLENRKGPSSLTLFAGTSASSDQGLTQSPENYGDNGCSRM